MSVFNRELLDTIERERAARRRRPTRRGITTETRPAVALFQAFVTSEKADRPVFRHCGYCGHALCGCGLEGYVT